MSGGGGGGAIAVVIDDLGIGDGSGVLDDGSADGIDPLLLLFLGISDEVHGVAAGGELEGELAVEGVLGALDGEAGGDGDDSSGDGGARDGGFLEPEELPLLENEPTPPPRLYILPLLVQPPGSLRIRPELHPSAHLLRRPRSHRRSPKASHPPFLFLLLLRRRCAIPSFLFIPFSSIYIYNLYKIK